MIGQKSLFDVEPRAPPEPARPAKFRMPLERNDVRSPWGTRDKKGNLFYEKMWKALEDMDEADREIVNFILAMRPVDQIDKYERIFRLYRQATNFDLIDFDESRGR